MDEAVDFFLEGEVQQSEAFVFFAQSKVDGRRIQVRDEPGSRLLLQLLDGCSRFVGVDCGFFLVFVPMDGKAFRSLPSLHGAHFAAELGGDFSPGVELFSGRGWPSRAWRGSACRNVTGRHLHEF